MLTTIEIERQSNVAWVWLSRPDVRNAFDDVMINGNIRCFGERFVGQGCGPGRSWAIILCGCGPKLDETNVGVYIRGESVRRW